MIVPAHVVDPAPRSRGLHRQLYVQVLVAIAAGALIGHFFPATGEALKPLGDAFIKLGKMLIAPVIFLTVVTGIAGMRDLNKVGGVALKAFAYFLAVRAGRVRTPPASTARPSSPAHEPTTREGRQRRSMLRERPSDVPARAEV